MKFIISLIKKNSSIFYILNRLYYNAIGFFIFRFHKYTNYFFYKVKFRLNHGYNLNLNNPISFNENIIYKKLYNRNNLLVITSDKVKVRSYVEEKVGKEVLVPLLYCTDNPNTIDFNSLPKKFIVKSNHGSGLNHIVTNKNTMDKKDLLKKCDMWLRTQNSLEKLEWAYSKIQRKILVEELLLDEKGKVPKDYKFHIYKGKCTFVQVDFDRFKNRSRSLFDSDFNYLNASLKYKQGVELEKPAAFERMKGIAEKLGEDFEFVRIDLYLVNGKVYFGEITHYHGSGLEVFNPKRLDFEFGKNIIQ